MREALSIPSAALRPTRATSRIGRPERSARLDSPPACSPSSTTVLAPPSGTAPSPSFLRPVRSNRSAGVPEVRVQAPTRHATHAPIDLADPPHGHLSLVPPPTPWRFDHARIIADFTTTSDDLHRRLVTVAGLLAPRISLEHCAGDAPCSQPTDALPADMMILLEGLSRRLGLSPEHCRIATHAFPAGVDLGVESCVLVLGCPAGIHDDAPPEVPAARRCSVVRLHDRLDW